MPTALIVGASRGIGLGLARAYAVEGWRVHATSRRPERPGALGELEGTLLVHRFDVRDPAEELVEALGGEAIDLFVHNAGVSDRHHDRDAVMEINAAAPIRVAEALLPQISASRERKLILMTSQLGARHGRSRDLGTYGDSKAALNDAFRERAARWIRTGVRAVVVHPGWVRTEMGGASAPLSVEDSVAGMQRVFAGLGDDDHGRFLTWEGNEHPW